MSITALPITGPCIVELAITGDEIADMEAIDCVLHGQDLEHVDVGPIAALGGAYLRVTSPDLVVAADELRSLGHRIADTVLEARQDALDAERHVCFCGVRLDPDVDTCGDLICARRYFQELSL